MLPGYAGFPSSFCRWQTKEQIPGVQTTLFQQLQAWASTKSSFHSDNCVAMLSKNVSEELKFCFAGGRRPIQYGLSPVTAKVCLNRGFDLTDFLGTPGEEEASFVQRVSSLASASLSLRGRVWISPSPLGLLRSSQCQCLIEQTDCHHQAHQEGSRTKPPATKDPWATDHDQFSFSWPLATLLEKS